MRITRNGMIVTFKVRLCFQDLHRLPHTGITIGLTRARDTMLGQLRELNKSKPRSKGDENLVAEITRLESTLTLARDDLVRSMAFHMRAWFSHLRAQASLNSRLKGVQDEMKHLNLELKRGAPELKQVCYLSDTRC